MVDTVGSQLCWVSLSRFASLISLGENDGSDVSGLKFADASDVLLNYEQSFGKQALHIPPLSVL